MRGHLEGEYTYADYVMVGYPWLLLFVNAPLNITEKDTINARAQ